MNFFSDGFVSVCIPSTEYSSETINTSKRLITFWRFELNWKSKCQMILNPSTREADVIMLLTTEFLYTPNCIIIWYVRIINFENIFQPREEPEMYIKWNISFLFEFSCIWIFVQQINSACKWIIHKYFQEI